MKKIALLLLLSTVLTTSLTVFTACSSQETGATDTTPSVTTAPQATDAPTIPSAPGSNSTLEHNVKLNADLDTMKVVVEKSEPKIEEYEGYSMVTSGAEWEIPTNVDYSLYDFLGSGNDLISDLQDEEKNRTYANYFKNNRVNYFRVTYTDGVANFKKVGQPAVTQTKALGAKLVIDRKLNRLLVYYQAINLRTSSDYASVTGKIGSFVNISFHTTAPVIYNVSVTKEAKSTSDGYINHKNLVPRQTDDGSFVGTAKFTLPYTAEPGEYYINFIINNSCVQSIPLTLEAGTDPRSDSYHLMLAGDWDLIGNDSYKQSMIDLFYSVYPRLIARWGIGTEPDTIIFYADTTYDGVAYASGNTVTVATDYARENPHDIGFFSHELTHNAQQYNFNYGDDAWWTENMATYGGFRHFHWSDPNYIQLCDKSEESVYYWPSTVDSTTYGPYGNGCKWFFAYMDYHWPTTQGPNGERINGLIDTINFEIKQGRLLGGSDNPTDKNNMFNKIVKEVTGYDCMEDIRKKYAEEFKSGVWDFKGFADYDGNFVVENLPGVPNPQYPMITDKNPGDKTAAKLETPVTEGTNLALGASIYKVSGAVNSKELGSMLVDGDLKTKWCCTSGSASDKTYSLDGALQWIVLDLGEEKTFNTYTIYNTKTQETGGNTTEWEILLSDDAKNWVSVDYQPNCNDNIVSFNIGTQSARYILLKGYTVDTGAGTIRLYEFQLYNQQ